MEFYEIKRNNYMFLDRLEGRNHLQCANHMHYHIEFVYMRKGHTVGTIDSEEYEIGDDTIFISFPNQIHGYRGNDREEYVILIVNPEVTPEFLPLFNSRVPKVPVLRNASRVPGLTELIELLRVESARPGDSFQPAALSGCLNILFATLFRAMPLAEQTIGDSHTLRTIVNFCARNFNRELSLEILGSELHMSKYYISHLFSEKFNMRFNDYINSLRVSEACRYLDNTAKSITEISELVGFATMRTFNRAFLKEHGITPSTYRRTRIDAVAVGESDIHAPRTKGGKYESERT